MSVQPKRAVVTGGAGFIGSHVVDALIKRGLEVLVIDDFSTGMEANLASAKDSGRLFVVCCDIVDGATNREILAFRPDAIFHHAAQMNVRRSVAEPLFDCEKNVKGTLNIAVAARDAGVKLVSFASTGGAIYGEQITFPAPEEHPVHAECPYGVSKRCGELYLEYYARSAGMHCVALRYANIYGPRQNAKGEAGVVAIFSEKILAGEPLTVNGDGEQTRDFVYVDDVVAANLAVLDWKFGQAAGEPAFSVFNVGRGVENSVLDVVDGLRMAASKLGISKDLSVRHGPALPGEQRRSVIDATRIAKALKWQPTISLEAGLCSTLDSFAKTAPSQQGPSQHRLPKG